MTDFLKADTNLPSYMMFPRFLLDMEINETAKMLYIILLDRARLSQKNEGWSDTDGHVFIYFTIEALAEVLHKSQMTVKTALAVLEKQELIFRKRQGPGQNYRTTQTTYARPGGLVNWCWWMILLNLLCNCCCGGWGWRFRM